MLIRKAERKKAKLRLALTGATNGGKTWSALEIAFGMSSNVGMIDTESGRGELYAGCTSKHDSNIIFDYDYHRIEAPYSPEKYIEAIKEFEKIGCEVLIIDSLSHAWIGDGGILSIVDKAGSNSFTNGWRIATPKQNALVNAIITSKMHIIVTMRSKTEWVIEKNENGKNVPRKIGLAPVQRDGLEYEFTVITEMSGGEGHVTKDNTGIYNNQFIKPSPEMGRKLIAWLDSGIDPKESFFKKTLPAILTEINNSNTVDELRSCFGKYYTAYKDQFPETIEALVAAKDARRYEILEAEKEVAVAKPAISTVSAYSTALTNIN